MGVISEMVWTKFLLQKPFIAVHHQKEAMDIENLLTTRYNKEEIDALVNKIMHAKAFLKIKNNFQHDVDHDSDLEQKMRITLRSLSKI